MVRIPRLARVLALCCAAFLCSSCNWMLNEFFVYDVPPPVVEEGRTGVEPTW